MRRRRYKGLSAASFGNVNNHWTVINETAGGTITSIPNQVSGGPSLNKLGTGDINLSTVNSHTVAVTNGSSNALKAYTPISSGLNSNTPWTVVLVAKRSNLTSLRAFWSISDDSQSTAQLVRSIMLKSNETSVFLRSSDTTNQLIYTSSEVMPNINDLAIFVSTWDGENIKQYINGQLVFRSDNTQYSYTGAGTYKTATNVANNITFGGLSRNSPSSLELATGINFGESITYNEALTQEIVHDLSKWLGSRWDIDILPLAKYGWVRHDFTITGAPIGDLTSIASTGTDTNALVPASPQAWFQTPTIDVSEPNVLNMYGDKSAQVTSTACSNGETFTAVSVLRTVAADSFSYGRVLALSGTGAASGNSELSITMNPLGTAPNDLVVYDGLAVSPNVTVDLSDYHVLVLEYDNQTSNVYLDGIKILSFTSSSPRVYTSQKWILGNFDLYGSTRKASIYAKSFALIRGVVDQYTLAKQLNDNYNVGSSYLNDYYPAQITDIACWWVASDATETSGIVTIPARTGVDLVAFGTGATINANGSVDTGATSLRASSLSINNDEYTLFIVCKSTGTGNHNLFNYYAGTPINWNQFNRTSNVYQFSRQVGLSPVYSNSAIDATKVKVLSGVIGSPDYDFDWKINGTTIGTALSVSSGLTINNCIVNTTTEVYEIIIYNRTLSASEITAVENYLRAKYNSVIDI